MRTISTVVILLSAWAAVFAATDPARLPSASERILIAVPHYAVLADVCRTINGGSLHWNGRTATLVTGYDKAVISVECLMLSGGARVGAGDDLVGEVSICEQGNDAVANARSALLSEPGFLLPTGCELGSRHVAQQRSRTLLLKMNIECRGIVEDDSLEHCISLEREFKYFYEHVLGQSSAELLLRLQSLNDQQGAQGIHGEGPAESRHEDR